MNSRAESCESCACRPAHPGPGHVSLGPIRTTSSRGLGVQRWPACSLQVPTNEVTGAGLKAGRVCRAHAQPPGEAA